MDPKVSIIIPIYRTAEWLPKCLESCLNQTYGNIEIVLIEDGSPDNCGEICDEYAKKDARIVVIHQKNSGVSAARNVGLKKASGELILFVDSDDWIDSDMVSCMVSEQLAGHYDLVVCGHRSFFQQQLYSEEIPAKAELRDQTGVVSACFDRKIRFSFTPCAKLDKKSIIEAFGLHFDTSLTLHEDNCFVLDYLEHTETCLYIDKALYNVQHITYDKSARYRWSDIEYHWNLSIKIIEKYTKLFLNTGTYSRFKEKVDAYIMLTMNEYFGGLVGAGCPRRAIVAQMKKLPANDMYKDLKALPLENAVGFFEKFSLICYKYKLWNLLYICTNFRSNIWYKYVLKIH